MNPICVKSSYWPDPFFLTLCWRHLFLLASFCCVARRAFYSGSVVVNISRNSLPDVDGGIPQISMENVANRRRFEVPGELFCV